MHAEAATGSDVIFVDHAERAKVSVFRVVVIGERKAEAAVEPVEFAVPAVGSRPNLEHGSLLKFWGILDNRCGKVAKVATGSVAAPQEGEANPQNLGFTGGADFDFADEAAGIFGDESGDRVGDVLGLKHFRLVAASVGRKFGDYRPGTDSADANPMRAQVFGSGFGEAEQ